MTKTDLYLGKSMTVLHALHAYALRGCIMLSANLFTISLVYEFRDDVSLIACLRFMQAARRRIA